MGVCVGRHLLTHMAKRAFEMHVPTGRNNRSRCNVILHDRKCVVYLQQALSTAVFREVRWFLNRLPPYHELFIAEHTCLQCLYEIFLYPVLFCSGMNFGYVIVRAHSCNGLGTAGSLLLVKSVTFHQLSKLAGILFIRFAT